AHLTNITFWPPIRGPLWAYRHKARLSVKYVAKKQRVLVGFREKATRFIADIGHCGVLHPRVGNKLTEIADLVNSLSIRSRIPQIEVAVDDSGLCVLVFRNLSEAGFDDRLRLKDFGRSHDFTVYLQPKGPDSVYCVDECEAPTLSYALPKHGVKLTFEALQFTQVNVDLNRLMVDRAIQLLNPGPDDRVIDLFCGIGNFTLPIARHVERVVGIEGNRELIEQARKNAAINRVKNASFQIADLNTDVAHEEWCRDSYTLALLDPSRAGAEAILKYFPRWGVRRIVYISCNPATLARDSKILTANFGYRIQGAGVMDMFPQTSHVESIALLEKD
ncbi:MAG: 23S rRNA (uracil(1939)-C(5))-methyltransferase RlmD, partial [Methylococcales bacterium]